MNAHAVHSRIVADGFRRAEAGAAVQIERRIEEIERRYERLMQRASWRGRLIIHRRMQRRIRRVRERIAPKEGLYAVRTRRLAGPQRRRGWGEL